MSFGAGPLDIRVEAPDGPTRDLLRSTLSLYDVEWTLTPRREVAVGVEVVAEPTPQPARGEYMTCAQMLVDVGSAGLWATTSRGASLRGVFDDGRETWSMRVPRRIPDEGWWPEIEDLVSLIVTTGWRRAGWVPLHAAGLVKDGRGVLACATSRGGKTTFTLAMARRGWKVVGDDKLLLGSFNGGTVIAAVKHMLNVDPAVEEWFPEVGDLGRLPIYSEWSPKRRVELKSIFPDAPVSAMTPTLVISLLRSTSAGRVWIQPMSVSDTIATLLRQTVIPSDRPTARWITASLALLGQRSRGYQLTLPEHVYDDPGALDEIEAALS